MNIRWGGMRTMVLLPFCRRFVAVFDLFANGKMNSFSDIKIVAYIVEYNLHWTSIFQISFPGS